MNPQQTLSTAAPTPAPAPAPTPAPASTVAQIAPITTQPQAAPTMATPTAAPTVAGQMMRPVAGPYTAAQLMPPLLDNDVNMSDTKHRMSQKMQQFADNIENGRQPGLFADVSAAARDLGRRTATEARFTKQAAKDAFDNIHTMYTDKYAAALQSGQYTTDATAIAPDYAAMTPSVDAQLQAYNTYVISQVVNKRPIDPRVIPPLVASSLPPGYAQDVNAYNAYTQFDPALSKNMIFPKDRLILRAPASPAPTPVPPPAPEGFTALGVNVFFKRLESTLKNQYSDLMGEYRVPPAEPSRLFIDKNYKFVVVQGQNRRVFTDVVEARKFALMGAFQADAVQQYRASMLVTNKLRPQLRVIPRVSA
jgi:hypothetical protein